MGRWDNQQKTILLRCRICHKECCTLCITPSSRFDVSTLRTGKVVCNDCRQLCIGCSRYVVIGKYCSNCGALLPTIGGEQN